MFATVANGWYVLWWPGEMPPGTSVLGLDVLGTEVATIEP
jgi:hypothetical protein